MFATYWGQLGVEIFFMISGFVIFMTIESCQVATDFIWSRFTRLFPTYWVCLIITCLQHLLFGPPAGDKCYNTCDLSLSQVIWNCFMMIRYMQWPWGATSVSVPERSGVVAVSAVYWSLTYELTFYTLILIIFLLRKLSAILSIIIAWLALSIFDQFARLYDPSYGISYAAGVLNLILTLKYAQFFCRRYNLLYALEGRISKPVTSRTRPN